MTRLTDYAVALLAQFVVNPGRHSAREMSSTAQLPGPAVSKVLKILARNGLLETHRGKKGGFTLARAAGEITVAEVLRAFEGPLAITECAGHDTSTCDLEPACAVSGAWKRINAAMEAALEEVTLADMVAGHGERLGRIQETVRSLVGPGPIKV